MGAPYRMMLDLFFGFAPRESVVLTEFDSYMHPGIISFGSDGRFPPPPPPQKKKGGKLSPKTIVKKFSWVLIVCTCGLSKLKA